MLLKFQIYNTLKYHKKFLVPHGEFYNSQAKRQDIILLFWLIFACRIILVSALYRDFRYASRWLYKDDYKYMIEMWEIM